MSWSRATKVAPAVLRRAEAKSESTVSLSTVTNRLAGIYKSMLTGLIAIVIALCLHFAFEHTPFSEKLDEMAYGWLQGYVQKPDDVPIRIVDLQSGYDLPDTDGRTDLKKLAKLLERVLKHKPKAVAIDIDFSYVGGGKDQPLDPEEIVTKPALESTKAGIPVFIAVGDGLARMPEDWFGSGYESLGVHTAFVPGGTAGQTHILSSLQINGRTVESMSEQLANAMRPLKDRPNLPSSIATRFGEPYEDRADPRAQVEGRQYLANVASLDSLIKNTIRLGAEGRFPMEEEFEGLRDKAVIIGTTNVKEDLGFWQVPGQPGRREAGVYLIGVGTFTNLTAPLYVLRPAARFVVNFLCGSFVLFVIYAIRRAFVTRKESVNVSAVTSIAIAITVFGMIGAGIAFVRVFNLLWNEFFASIFLLLFDPRIHHGVEHLHRSEDENEKHGRGIFLAEEESE